MNAIRWLGGVAGSVLMTHAALAQQPLAVASGPAGSLDSIVARALQVNPRIIAAERRVEAAAAAVGPAGALEDPMLMAGLMNQPLDGRVEEMAMRVIGASQRIPFPGKLRLQRGAVDHELDAAGAELDGARRAVVRDVKEAYYDLVFLDRSREVLARTQQVLSEVLLVTEAGYGVGTGAQVDVLTARLELAGLAAEAVELEEGRRAALARLNALLSRPSDTPLDGPTMPEPIARAAVLTDGRGVRFTSAALGASAADSPLPDLATLQEEALRANPEIRAHEAMIAAEDQRVALARKAHLPDFDVSVQWGQRGGHADLVSATVSVPIPVRKGKRQDLGLRQAEATLAAAHAEHAVAADQLRADVAAAYAETERARTQLALLIAVVLPQGRAAFEATTAGFQVGQTDFLTLLETQATLYGYETAYHRALTDFAAGVAELERLVGREIL